MRTGKTRNKICLIAAVLWMAVIFAFSARNADDSTGDSYYIGRAFAKMCIPAYETWDEAGQQEFIERIDHPVRKTAHATEYAVLGCLLILAISPVSLKRRKEASDDNGAGKEPNKAQALRKGLTKSILLAWGIATVYAATDEFHQTFVPGRAGRVSDVALDSAGAAIGILLTLGWVILPYVVLFGFMLIKNLGMQLWIGDDMIFRGMLTKMSWWDFSTDSYLRRNGRMFTDQLAAIFIKLPPIVFYIANSLCFVVIACVVRRLFMKKGFASSVLVCFFTALFPFWILDSQGIMAVSCNYVFPATMLSIALSFLPRMTEGTLKWYHYAVGGLTAFLAADHEQAAVAALLAFGMMSLFTLLVQKKKYAYLYVGFLSALAGFLIVLLAPGRTLRAEDASIFHIPGYESYTIFDKLYMGSASTLSFYTAWAVRLFVVFALLLIVAVWMKQKRLIYRILSFVPFGVMAFAELTFRIPALEGLRWITRTTEDWTYEQTYFGREPHPWFGLLLTALMIVSILLSLLAISDTREKKAIAFLVVSVGFASRLAMGFSATLFGSGRRTHTLMSVSIIMLCAYLTERIRTKDIRNEDQLPERS